MSQVDELLALDDTAVLARVRDAFKQNLLASPAISAIDQGAQRVPYILRENHSPNALFDEAAVAIAVLAVASTASFGFNGTVNGGAASTRLGQLLTPSNDSFVQITHDMYFYFFPDLSTSQYGSFSNIVNEGSGGAVMYRFVGGQNNWDALGTQLANTLVSDAFVTTQMGVYNANPANFVQRMYMYLHMVELMAPLQLDTVKLKWDPLIHINSIPWTTYNSLTAPNFNEQTFGAQIGQAASTSRVTGHHPGQTFCHGGPAASCYTSQGPDAHVYGEGLANWISATAGSYPAFFTGAGPSNTD